MTTTYNLLPQVQFFDSSGNPLASGTLTAYTPGTTTPKAIYTSATGATPLANPVTLNASGGIQTNNAGAFGTGLYDLLVKDSTGTTIYTLSSVGNAPDITTSSANVQLVKRTFNSNVTKSTGTAVMPLDDTKPQNNNTEGDLVVTVNHTPTSATATLRIRVEYYMSASAGVPMISLCQDSIADALTFRSGLSSSVTSLTYEMTAGTTSQIAFKIRTGVSSAGTLTINGSAGNRYGGGVLNSTVTIEEYVAI